MKKNNYIAACAAILCSLQALSAQDLNPTVEVSRQYEGKLMDVHKPVMKMALPDSVDKFNLEFDYSVFEKPFRSAYEFSPAVFNIDLAPDASDRTKFYLKAGAGYSLHPTLDLLWNPLSKNGLNLSVYGSHRSYIGSYKFLTPEYDQSLGTSAVKVKENGDRYFGYDMLSKAGVALTYDWKTGGAYFDAGYYGIALQDSLIRRGYDGVDIKAGVASKGNYGNKPVYRADVAYRFAEDKLTAGTQNWLGEHDFDLGAQFGMSVAEHHWVYLDFDTELGIYRGALDALAGNMSIIPGYVYRGGRWSVNAGLKLSLLFRNNTDPEATPLNLSHNQVIYPDIDVSFTVIRKYLDIYLDLDGGPELNRYSSVLASNHHIWPGYNPVGLPLLDNTDTRVSLALGLRGNVASRFTFDWKAGCGNVGNMMLPMIYAADGKTYAGVGYTEANVLFTRLDLGWKSQDVEAGGYLKYTATDVRQKSEHLFAPAALTSYVKAAYNWNRRITAGVDCEFATKRTGGLYDTRSSAAWSDDGVIPLTAVVPGYADLGIFAEVALTRKFSLWARGGNLLNMTIQRTPLYGGSGIHITAGIILEL